ncbi:MAG: hypothetical protein IJA01_02770 [Firmicutes bacterium]|nr:hypothetical protein [Lachnospiraceae bacterium]MBQ3611173.1 hypothetical protein [Bacillota bacterium]
MSRVCYFASDAPLKEKPNLFVKSYSINQAIAAGINLDMDILDGIDRDEPDMVLCMESEEHGEFPAIFTSQPYCEAPKSDKKYYADIGGSPCKDLSGIIEYIKDHMKKRKEENTEELELWYIWLGSDESEIIYKECSIKELTEDYLEEFFTDDENDYKIIITR